MKAKDITNHQCCGCKVCETTCPKSCISMKIDNEGFWYPVVDERVCVNCKQCQTVCPLNHQSLHDPVSECFAFVGDNAKLMSSSSGGAFETVCVSYLKNKTKYSIYGAALIQNKVHHIRITSLDQLELLKRSKYVQSDTDSIYRMVKNDLDNGLDVIFSGTPCQVQALRNFLKGKEDRLLTIDIVCHGVPSPLIFQKYCDYLESSNNSRIESFLFRYKQNRSGKWDTQGTRIVFNNSCTVEKTCYEDGYMTAFLNELITRPSCYECPFMKIQRCSDITFGDFWGIEDYYPELSLSKTAGCSLIIPNSEEGKRIINLLSYRKDEILKKCDVEVAMHKNKPLSEHFSPHKNRATFIQMVTRKPSLFPKYLDIALGYRKPFFYRLKKKLKTVFFS